jgi:glycosyltransferase involved in cell wall biosynthesis
MLYFGRLSPEKGLDFLIVVMRRLSKVRLRIAGTGLEEDKLKTLVERLKLKNVEFVGYQSGEALKRLIYQSRFTVLPSKCYENFPISVLEAFACGKPVIGSKIGGTPELIQNNYNGFLFKLGNGEDCMEKINKLWNNHLLCRKIGRNAKEYLEKNFGPEEHYDKLMEIYNKAIAFYKGY